MNRQRRSLVLTTESARHPFRMGLPPHVLAVSPQATVSRRSLSRRDLPRDLRDFLAAYVVTFVVVSAFIL